MGTLSVSIEADELVCQLQAKEFKNSNNNSCAWLIGVACGAALFVSGELLEIQATEIVWGARTSNGVFVSQTSSLVVNKPRRRRFSIERSDMEIEARFNFHLERWRHDTGHLSSYGAILSHPDYLAMVALGPQAIPFILRDLRKSGPAWFAPLEAMTNENPVPLEHESSMALMIEDWQTWGKNRGII